MILKKPKYFHSLIINLLNQYEDFDIDGVILIESRGYLFSRHVSVSAEFLVIRASQQILDQDHLLCFD